MTEKKHQGFRKTEENGGVRDPNIKVGPREPKKMTKRAIKDRELLTVLRKIKPHVSDAIMTAAKMLGDPKASENGKLRAAVILLDNYKSMMNSLYDGKDEDQEGTEVQPQEDKTPVFSLKVVNQE